jgi:hypothetical protein
MRDLTRATVTKASLIMLPVYPIFTGWLGLAYLLGDPARTATPTLLAIGDVLPIRAWGAAFLSFAVVLIVGYAMRSRDVTIFVLWMGFAAFGVWGIIFAVVVFTVPDTSLVGPAVWWFIAAAFAASARSVAVRET